MSQNAGQQLANSENQGLIDQFVEISGVDRERARFYLETAGFDLPLALSGFFEGGFDADDEQPEVIFDRSDNDDDVQIIEEPNEDGDELVAASNLRSIEAKRAGEMSGKEGGKAGDDQKKKFATLFSQGGPSTRDDGGGSSDEDDKGQAFYVGGSEKSGQQVLGPPKKKGENIAERFFKQAKERGAEQIDASQRAEASAGAGSSKSTFGGAGYRLGDAVKPSEKVGGMEVDVDEVEPPVVTVVMRMWQNGFSVDDEPLRTFEEPANRQFLEHIMQGRVPPELIHAHRGKRVDLEMEDHRQEDYKPPKRAVKAFSGQGHTLGSPVPEVIGAGKVGEKAAVATAANGPPAAVGDAAVLPPVDETKPITNIQIRLGNGERLVMKLNHHRTIKDLREFICKMRPDLAGRTFILMTSFPSKELTDESVTLEEAKLLNAVIIQRFK